MKSARLLINLKILVVSALLTLSACDVSDDSGLSLQDLNEDPLIASLYIKDSLGNLRTDFLAEETLVFEYRLTNNTNQQVVLNGSSV